MSPRARPSLIQRFPLLLVFALLFARQTGGHAQLQQSMPAIAALDVAAPAIPATTRELTRALTVGARHVASSGGSSVASLGAERPALAISASLGAAHPRDERSGSLLARGFDATAPPAVVS